MHHNSFNFEYANATDRDLARWELDQLAREAEEYEAWQNERYDESVRKSYEARGLFNIY